MTVAWVLALAIGVAPVAAALHLLSVPRLYCPQQGELTHAEKVAPHAQGAALGAPVDVEHRDHLGTAACLGRGAAIAARRATTTAAALEAPALPARAAAPARPVPSSRSSETRRAARRIAARRRSGR